MYSGEKPQKASDGITALPSYRLMPAASASQSRAADSVSVLSTACRSKVERLITLRTSAVAACRCSASSNARVFVASSLANAVADTFADLVRVLVFASAERIRLPRLRSFAFDSPRLICRRPMDSVGRNANLAHLSRPAHASERPYHDTTPTTRLLRVRGAQADLC